MSREHSAEDKRSIKKTRSKDKQPDKHRPTGPSADVGGVLRLQQSVGNQAVQRLLAQRSSDDAFDLDDETTNRINRERGGGQSLDDGVQQQLGATMDHDFSDVQVHTSPEANALNRQLQAKAFTTGRDVFFKEGAYDPGSSGGQELIAHELTHVVQQSSGTVGSSGGGMTVNAAGDVYEQEADAVAKQAVKATGREAGVQATGSEGAQRQAVEDEISAKRDDVQRQEEEEEMAMTKRDDVQRQEEEEEMAMTKRDDVQRQEEEELEEMAMTKRDDVQRQEELPEEEL